MGNSKQLCQRTNQMLEDYYERYKMRRLQDELQQDNCPIFPPLHATSTAMNKCPFGKKKIFNPKNVSIVKTVSIAHISLKARFQAHSAAQAGSYVSGELLPDDFALPRAICAYCGWHWHSRGGNKRKRHDARPRVCVCVWHFFCNDCVYA